MSSDANLILTDNDPDHPGLLMRYTDPSPGLLFGDLCALLLGAGCAGLGVYFVINWEGMVTLGPVAAMLVLGAAIIVGAWDSIRSRRKGLDIWYQVTVADGIATFSYSGDREPVMLTLTKIGRIWIQRNSVNHVLREVYLVAYYDGTERQITNLLTMNNLIGEKNISHFTSQIVDYLNRKRHTAKSGKRLKHAEVINDEIQCGYRYDYAADTPQAARNQCTLAPAKTIWLWSALFALVIYLMCLSPFSIVYLGDKPELILAAVGVVLTLIYAWATDRLGSCHCRERSFFRIVFTIIVGFILHLPVYYAREKFGIGWLIYPEPLISIPVMTWLVFRGLSGCDCGARKK